MADEITIRAGLGVTNGSFKIPFIGQETFTATQLVQGGGGPGVLEIPVADTLIDTSGYTDVGWCRVTNLDDTNFVDLGPGAAGALVPYHRLYPGQSHVLQLVPGVELRALADTAPVKIQLIILEA
jgi:hypothetical protein